MFLFVCLNNSFPHTSPPLSGHFSFTRPLKKEQTFFCGVFPKPLWSTIFVPDLALQFKHTHAQNHNQKWVSRTCLLCVCVWKLSFLSFGFQNVFFRFVFKPVCRERERERETMGVSVSSVVVFVYHIVSLRCRRYTPTLYFRCVCNGDPENIHVPGKKLPECGFPTFYPPPPSCPYPRIEFST